jgi:hypothetical protein
LPELRYGYQIRRRGAALVFGSLLFAAVACENGPSMLDMSKEQQAQFIDCQKDLRTRLQPGTLSGLVDVDGACFDRLSRESDLVTERITHNTYVIQQHQTRDLMWMVVTITLAGVGLACMQLYAGFRLAMSGKATFDSTQGGSIDVEAKKLSLNSSVSGLLVLALSLCFFYIFTDRIYTIQNDRATKGRVSESASPEATISQSSVSAHPVEAGPGTVVAPVDPSIAEEAAKQRAKDQ